MDDGEERCPRDTMSVDSLVDFIYLHRTGAYRHEMPYSKMYSVVKLFLASHRKPLSYYDGRQVETAAFTMTLFSVLHSIAFHPKEVEILKEFLTILARVSGEPSLPDVPTNDDMDMRHNLLLYFDFLEGRKTTPLRGIVPTTYDFSMEAEYSFPPKTDAETTYFNALTVSLYAFVYALRKYENDPRPFVTRFFTRNAELEALSDKQVCKSFTEMPLSMDMSIDF